MDTAQRILDVAERLVQTQGFNGFSYADIAAELGITKASLHYHFATKAALGSALITRYGAEFGRALEGAMLVARSYGDPERFTSAAQRLLAELSGRRKLAGRTDRAQR